MKRKLFLSACLLALALMLSGCDDTPTPTDLAKSDAIYTIDVCTVQGDLKDGVLSMQVDYEVTNHGEEAVSEVTLLTPHLDGSTMNDLQAVIGGETYQLQLQEKDLIPLDTPLQPDESLSLSFTYHLDELKMPDGSSETWRITLPTLEKSAIETGVGKAEIQLTFDREISIKSSVPKGLEQVSSTEIAGELGATVNLLIINVT